MIDCNAMQWIGGIVDNSQNLHTGARVHMDRSETLLIKHQYIIDGTVA